MFCFAGLVTGIGVGAGYASVPDTDGTIHGCYAKRDGTLRVVEVDTGCGRNELPLFWSQTGPAGADGQDGQQGPPGGAVPGTLRTGGLVSMAPEAVASAYVDCLPGEYLAHGGYDVFYPGTNRSGAVRGESIRDTNADGIADGFIVAVRNTSDGELLVFAKALCAPLTG